MSLLPLGWTLSTLTAIALASATAAPAQAAEIWFDDPSGFGMTLTTAQSSGVPIVSGFTLDDIENGLPTDRLLDEGSYQSGPPARVTSDWSVSNDVGDGRAAQYLVFVQPLDNPDTVTVGGEPQDVSYDPADVGLDLVDAGGFSWSILAVTFDGDGTVYYPAVSLNDLGDGQTTGSRFAVNYVLENPQIFLDADGFELGLPKWSIKTIFLPIPEPSTAALLGFGVAAIAWRRRRR